MQDKFILFLEQDFYADKKKIFFKWEIFVTKNFFGFINLIIWVLFWFYRKPISLTCYLSVALKIIDMKYWGHCYTLF